MKRQSISNMVFLTLLLPLSAFAGESDFKFEKLEQQACSVHDNRLAKKIRYELNKFIETAHYDRSVYYLETDVNPLNAVENRDIDRCQFDSKNLFKKHGSANCVGMAGYFQEYLSGKQYFNRRLRKLTPLPPFQLLSSVERQCSVQPHMPDYTHLALILWCRDGYILVDPAMNIPEPLFLQNGKPSSVDMRFRGRWHFALDLRDALKPKINVTADSSNPLSQPWDEKKKTDSSYYYLLQENKNADQSISAKYYLNDRKVLIFRLNRSNQAAYRITINLNKKQIECTETSPKGHIKAIFTLPFADYHQHPEKLEEYVNAGVARELRMPLAALRQRIKTVIDRTSTDVSS